MMMSPGAIVAVREVVDPADFYRDSHAKIYQAALHLHDAGEPVDAITVTGELERRGTLDDVGGKTRIYEIANLVPASANARHYAELVRDAATLRGFIRLGGEIAQLGWEREGSVADLAERIRRRTDDLLERGNLAGRLQAQTWAEFERDATERVPMLVDELWPEGGLGFIGAAPKKGKTWVGLDLAISVATGTSFLGAFDVPTAQPVILLALEGHKAAIRGRIGALTRGRKLDPGTHAADLANLHVLYKPAGINLTDAGWTRAIHDLARSVDARLIVVDVLRAAAVLKENSNDEFRDLVRTLQPITTSGCAIALLHHFSKLTEVSKERTAGERMAGAGAMYGAFDVGVFIVNSETGARFLELEFETRDLVSPPKTKVFLEGRTSGPNGGFTFNDAATWTETDHDPGAPEKPGNAAVVKAWLEQQPSRQATEKDLAAALGLTQRTLRRRRVEDFAYEGTDIIYEPAIGGNTPARYRLRDPNRPEPEQLDLKSRVTPDSPGLSAPADPGQTPGQTPGRTAPDCPTPPTLSGAETPDLQGVPTPGDSERTAPDNGACPTPKTPDLQALSARTAPDTSYGGAAPLDGTHHREHDNGEPGAAAPAAVDDNIFE